MKERQCSSASQGSDGGEVADDAVVVMKFCAWGPGNGRVRGQKPERTPERSLAVPPSVSRRGSEGGSKKY